jgi:hypothetical protein
MAASSAPAGVEQLVYLWPCNLAAWHCWCDLQTQWRTGVGGATGLDYASVHAYLQAAYAHDPLQPQALRDTFAGIRAAERATLEVWAEQRKSAEQSRS